VRRRRAGSGIGIGDDIVKQHLRQILSGNDVRPGDGLLLTALPSLFDVTGDGVDERVNCTVGELGACGGDGQRPYQRWVHIDFAEVGKPIGHADGQDRRR
jgi:hypothetical protein